MKYSIGSLIIQKILLDIVSDTFFKILITISGITVFITACLPRTKYFNGAMKAFVFMLFLRYIIVLAITMNAIVDHAFIREKLEKNIQVLKGYSTDVDSISNMPGMALEIEKALNQELEDLQQDRGRESSKLENISDRIITIEKELVDIQSRMSALKDEIGFIKGMNLFNGNERVRALDAELASKESEHEELLSEKDTIESTLDDIKKDIVSVEDRLSGKDKGVVDSLKSKFSNITTGMKAFKSKIYQLIDRMGEAVPTILNMMALFFFRVMILPLGFLYLFMKGFKLIWRVDLMTLGKA